jgi:glycosyltransferase involved in cell wall biosynthesis
VLKAVEPRVRIYHNIMWARYKGAIFSKIFALHGFFKLNVAFIHVAETSDKRMVFGPPDYSYHAYPHELLFKGSYDQIPRHRLVIALVGDILRKKCELVVIPGYDRIEHWVMLWACMALGRKRAVFCDSTAKDNVKNRFKEIAKSFFFHHCHGIFCYGTRSKEYVQSYGIDPRLIYSPCQAAALPHDYDATAVLTRYQACAQRDGESPTFLFVGRMSKEKGLEDLLAAFRRIHEYLPKAKLLLAGPESERDRLRSQALALGLEKSIGFRGNQTPDQIGELLESCTAMVLPSRREPWGLVVNEALSYGCPVVVSDICGCTPELVLNGVTGYVFPAGDVGAQCESMLQAIALNDNRLNTAKRCLEVISQYTPERAALEILKGCNQILKSTSHNPIKIESGSPDVSNSVQSTAPHPGSKAQSSEPVGVISAS